MERPIFFENNIFLQVEWILPPSPSPFKIRLRLRYVFTIFKVVEEDSYVRLLIKLVIN